MKLVLITAIIGVCVSEGFLRVSRFRIHKTVQTISWKALHVLRSSQISAHWKELALFKYSVVLMGCSLKLLLSLLAIAAIAGMALLGYHLLGGAVEPVVNSWTGVLLITLFSVIYLLWRTSYFARN